MRVASGAAPQRAVPGTLPQKHCVLIGRGAIGQLPNRVMHTRPIGNGWNCVIRTCGTAVPVGGCAEPSGEAERAQANIRTEASSFMDHHQRVREV
jgi:hypothetical protein